MIGNRDWVLNDYLTADEAKLRQAIGWREEHIAGLETAITESEEWIAKYQAELNRRAIAAFPLKIGDKFWVSGEMIDKYSVAGEPPFECKIDGIRGTGDGNAVAWSYHQGIATDDLILMRQAYLERGEQQ